jgi:hypothetical protein
MLRALDMLVGLAVVMLIVSVAVTTLVQIVAAVRNWRGKHLLEGIALLLNEAHPLLKDHAREIANAVLKHPLLATNGRLGDYVSKDELVRVLLALASGEAIQDTAVSGLHRLGMMLAGEMPAKPLSADAQNVLRQALQSSGLKDPALVLKRIHLVALNLEATHPELDAEVRQGVAVLKEASSEIVARMHTWFDHSVERVKQRFSYDARKLTTICALAVAIGLQLDAIDLMRRLSVDDELRSALVEQASAAMQAYNESVAAPGDVTGVADALSRVETQKARLNKFGVTGYSLWPENWLKDWNVQKLPGILLSWILLSLGAPFWYEVLKNFLKLRSVLATKDDEEEKEKAAPKPVVAALVTPAPVVLTEEAAPDKPG